MVAPHHGSWIFIVLLIRLHNATVFFNLWEVGQWVKNAYEMVRMGVVQISWHFFLIVCGYLVL